MDKSKSSVPNESCFEDWVRNTSLFRQWEDTKREIQLHKWYKSEEAGHDIGWERASVDWMIHHGCKAEKEGS